jgi:hypothetical protein
MDYDVLALSGGGVFDLSRLDRFNGFEEVRFTTSPTFSSGWSYNRLTHLRPTGRARRSRRHHQDGRPPERMIQDY